MGFLRVKNKKEIMKLIIIDLHSRIPIYEQIKEQVIKLINCSVYKPGDRLPSIRTLASELKLNVNTVKRAFLELEADGVVYSVQGKGVFVSENALGNSKIKDDALENLKQSVNSAVSKGVSREEIEMLLNSIFKAGEKND